ncbi:MAG TPA: hypothetical protein QF564_27570 [Pirellulaceae bacterium]|nr:hypothetical protein [Pirellulaceae bacterium]
MPDDNGVVRRIAWKQICPWLMIFRIFRISISLPVLVLAVAGALLTPLGWWGADTLFVTDLDLRQPQFSEFAQANSDWPVALENSTTPASYSADSLLTSASWPIESNHVVVTYRKFTSPFAKLLDRQLSITQAAYLLFGGLWNLAVWAFFGGAITRLAAVQLGREERLGMGSAMKHATKNYVWYLLAPLFPLLGLVLTSLPVLALGGLMRLDVGVLIAGILWPLVLIAGLIMVIFLIGVLFGWPLMFPTISCEEGSDAFEAFSRSFSYTFQRPLHYLFYALVTILFGGVCWLVVSQVGVLVVEVSLWAASWGASSERLNDVLLGTSGTTVVENGGWLIDSCNGIVGVIVGAFNFSFFWCGATAIYLLLRRDADQTDIDEVFLEEAQQYGLPPMKTVESEKPLEAPASATESTSEPKSNDTPTTNGD